MSDFNHNWIRPTSFSKNPFKKFHEICSVQMQYSNVDTWTYGYMSPWNTKECKSRFVHVKNPRLCVTNAVGLPLTYLGALRGQVRNLTTFYLVTDFSVVMPYEHLPNFSWKTDVQHFCLSVAHIWLKCRFSSFFAKASKSPFRKGVKGHLLYWTSNFVSWYEHTVFA
jgi:hypothetical protein